MAKFKGWEFQKDASVKPWDLLNPQEPRARHDIVDQRMEICRSCTHFISFTQQCKKCGCLMNLKTRLAKAECPVSKWVATGEIQIGD
jgi:hypothetical protein